MKIIDLVKLKCHNFRLRHTKTIEQEYKLLLKYGYIEKDCSPIKCTKCGSTNLEDMNEEYGGYNIPDGVLCEFDEVCTDCGNVCGHWAYGGWNL